MGGGGDLGGMNTCSCRQPWQQLRCYCKSPTGVRADGGANWARQLAHSEHNWGGYFAAKAVFHAVWNPPLARGILTVPSKCSCTCSTVTSAHVRPSLQSGGQLVRNSEDFRYEAPHAQLSYRTLNALSFASDAAMLGALNQMKPLGFRLKSRPGEQVPP